MKLVFPRITMASSSAKQFISFAKHQFTLPREVIDRNSASRTLKVIALPLALRKLPGKTRPVCYYMLYPVPIPSPSTSSVKHGVMQMVSFWKSGLWVLGRMYRSLWNAAFIPAQYPFVANPASLQNRVYRVSERIVSRWAPRPEEDFMRSVDTQAQFIHFSKKAHIPLQSIALEYPDLLNKCDLKSLFTETCHDSAAQPAKQFRQILADLRKYAASVSVPSYRRSKMTLAVTIPFYMVLPAALLELDTLIMNTYTMNLHFADKVGGLIALPLAYNLIRIFSHNRCIKTGRFLDQVESISQNLVPTLQSEIERLEKLRGTLTISEESKAILDDQIQRVHDELESTGVKVSSSSSQANQMYTSMFSQLEHEGRDTDYCAWIDRESLINVSKAYNLKYPQLFKDVLRGTEKLKRQIYLEQQ